MTCRTQNNVQCYSQVLEREAYALLEPGTLIVLDMCWFSNEVSWFDRNLSGCWASCDTFFFSVFRYLFFLFDFSTTSWVVGLPTTFLCQFPGDPAGRVITCSGSHLLEMPDVPVSKIWRLWFYEYTSLPCEPDVISLSFFFPCSLRYKKGFTRVWTESKVQMFTVKLIALLAVPVRETWWNDAEFNWSHILRNVQQVSLNCDFILWELHWTFLICSITVAGLNLP
jgi:hypothetical protein